MAYRLWNGKHHRYSYLWEEPKGMDCSGFTKLVYFMHGIVRSRCIATSSFRQTDRRKGNFENAQPGDLVFLEQKLPAKIPRNVGTWVFISATNGLFMQRITSESAVRSRRPLMTNTIPVGIYAQTYTWRN